METIRFLSSGHTVILYFHLSVLSSSLDTRHSSVGPVNLLIKYKDLEGKSILKE